MEIDLTAYKVKIDEKNETVVVTAPSPFPGGGMAIEITPAKIRVVNANIEIENCEGTIKKCRFESSQNYIRKSQFDIIGVFREGVIHKTVRKGE